MDQNVVSPGGNRVRSETEMILAPNTKISFEKINSSTYQSHRKVISEKYPTRINTIDDTKLASNSRISMETVYYLHNNQQHRDIIKYE